jgi:hypothetical protein
MVDEAGDKWLEEHMRRGEQLIYIFYVLAALFAAAIAAEFAARKAAVPVTIATLILALLSLGVGGYIAYPVGRVRHKEFRFETRPEPNIETTPE